MTTPRSGSSGASDAAARSGVVAGQPPRPGAGGTADGAAAGARPPRPERPPGSRATALLLAGIGAVAIAVSAGLLAGGRTAGAGEPPANVLVNAPAPIDANNTPSLARNPTDPDNVVLAHRVDRPAFDARLHTSVDGGRSWQAQSLPLPGGKDRPYAPDVAFGPDGTLYVTYVNLTGAGNTPENLWLARSTDGGLTLSDPQRVAGELTLQARLTVGPDGTVHVTWLQAVDVALLALSSPARVVTVSSTDGGATFSEPVPVSDADRQRVGAASAAVDASGGLVVLYQDFKDNVRDFQNLEGPPWENPSALVVTRSDDGGRTFSPGVEVDDEVLVGRRFLVFLPEFPSLAAGPDGTLYVAWADARNGDEDVFVRRSPDGGASWQPPVRVNGNPLGDGTDQSLPKVAVADDGRVDVLFLDRGGDAGGHLAEAVLASSHDRAASFSARTVSDARFDSRIGPAAGPHLPPDLGSRLALVSWDGGALAAWTDTRLGSEATGRQDIFAAAVDLGSGWWRAVALLLLAAGLLAAFAAAVVATRRSAAVKAAGPEQAA